MIRFFVGLAIGFTLFWSSEGQAERLKLLTHQLSPFTMPDPSGHPVGAAAELVGKMARLSSLALEERFVPFSRLMPMVERNEADGGFVVMHRPDRAPKFNWIGPLFTSKVGFYRHKDAKLRVTSLEQVRQARLVAVTDGNSDHHLLTTLGFTNLDVSRNQDVDLYKVASQKVDLTPISDVVFGSTIRRLGIDKDLLVRTPVTLYHSDLYLILSKQVEARHLTHLQCALQLLRDRGDYEELLTRYGLSVARVTDFSRQTCPPPGD